MDYQSFTEFTRGMANAMQKTAPPDIRLSKKEQELMSNAVTKTLIVYVALMARSTGKDVKQVAKDCGIPKMTEKEYKFAEQIIDILLYRGKSEINA